MEPQRTAEETLVSLFEKLEETKAAEERLARKILQTAGWNYTCEIGALWLWHKRVGEADLFVDEASALHLVENDLPEGEEW